MNSLAWFTLGMLTAIVGGLFLTVCINLMRDIRKSSTRRQIEDAIKNDYIVKQAILNLITDKLENDWMIQNTFRKYLLAQFTEWEVKAAINNLIDQKAGK